MSEKEPLNQEKLDLLLKKEEEKLRLSAFEYWLGLGPERSTAAVAEHFKISRAAVSKWQSRDNWRAKLSMIMIESQELLRKRLSEKMTQDAEVDYSVLRNMKRRIAREVARLSGCKDLPHAIDAYIRVMNGMRLVAGEPTERVEHTGQQDFFRANFTQLLQITNQDGTPVAQQAGAFISASAEKETGQQEDLQGTSDAAEDVSARIRERAKIESFVVEDDGDIELEETDNDSEPEDEQE